MNLPFTAEEFFSVFQQYNESVWPAQVILNILAVVAIVLAVRSSAAAGRIIASILGAFWLWTGFAYHLAFFTGINPGAYAFALLNIVQGILFLLYGVLLKRLSFRFRADIYGLTGALLILYALVLYPLIGSLAGHGFPRNPTFGLPCPTTIFTFGLLLWTEKAVPLALIPLPLLWSLIGFSAALTLGVHEDIGLLVAGIIGSALLLLRARKTRQ
jgi:hypothetical protein